MAGVNQGTVPAKPDDAGRAVSGPGRITAVYAALSALWILLSDGLIGLFVDDAKQLMVISTVKGWAFVALTSAILFGLMRRMVQEHEAAHRTRTEALRLLEVISEKSTDAIYVKDRAGRYLLFNREAGRFVGKDPREVIGLDDRAIYPPAGAEMLMASDRKIMDQGEVQTLEETLPTPLGVLTFLTTKGPIYGQNGDPMGLFGIARDISERKESEVKNRCLVDSNIIGIFTFKLPQHGQEAADPYYGEVNGAFLRMLGYDREEFISRRIRRTDLTPPEWLERDRKTLAEFRATGAVQPFEKEYFRKDGSRVPVLVGVASFDEARTQGVAFVLDLTERKQAEKELQALAEQRAILGTALNRSHETAMLIDSSGRFLYANDEACRSLGYSREELLAMSVPDIDPSHSAERVALVHRRIRDKGPVTFEIDN